MTANNLPSPDPGGCKPVVTDSQVRVLRSKRMQGQTLKAAAAAAVMIAERL
jgi:hypothetical protein